MLPAAVRAGPCMPYSVASCSALTSRWCAQDGSSAAAEDVVAAQEDVAHHHHCGAHPGAGHLPERLLGRGRKLLQE